MNTKKFVAIDLGAESGRGILGEFNGDRVDLKILRRFPTYKTQLHSHIYWDVFAIYNEIKEILSEASKHGLISGVGITTWGVDYGLVGNNGLLLANPFNYRDRRTEGTGQEIAGLVSKEEIYQKTGIQFMPLNTLNQIYATQKEFPYLLEKAEHMLFMPDLFNFFLTGERVSEYTIATTSQMYDSRAFSGKESPRGSWADDIINRIGLPSHFLPEVVSPGTVIGNITGYLKEELSLQDIPVYAVCCHDTASAVVSVPAREGLWAYLSSGTWSLLGVEMDDPVIDDKSFRYNFTNEGGYGGTIRFLKNIMGLWILQECRRYWEDEGKSFSYLELTEMASTAEPFKAFIDVNHSDFLFPGNMPERILAYCKKTGQSPSEDLAGISRIVLESLAMEYRYNMENLEDSIGDTVETLHIVGGGSQNKLLSQFAASALKKTVITGPVEATSIGNILVQAMAEGDIADVSELRDIVRRSSSLFVFQPQDTGLWDSGYAKYRELKGGTKSF